MSGNLNLEMRLTANTSQLSTALNNAGSHVRNFTSQTNNAARSIAQGFQKVYQQLNGFSAVSKLAVAAGGYSVLSEALHRNLEFEKTLLDMKQTAEMTVSQAAEMRLLAVDAASRNLATPNEMAQGLSELARAGMKYDRLRSTIEESARAAVAFRSTVADIAMMDFDLQSKMNIDPADMKDVHNMLLYHAKSGRFEAKAMAAEAPKYLNAAAQVGIKGVGGLNLMGAVTQVLMQNAPANQQAEVSTYAQHGFGHLSQKHFYKRLREKFGIDVKKYMPDGQFYGEDGVEGFMALMHEMKRKKLDNVFNLDEAGAREDYFKKFLLGIMKNEEQIKEALKIAKAKAKFDMVGDDKAEIMNSNYAKVKQAQITKEKAQVSDSATSAVSAWAKLNGWVAENPATAVAGGVAAIAGWRFLKNKMGSAGGNLLEKAVGGVGGAGMPVMVTNWPADLGGRLKPSERLSRLPGAATSAGTGATAAAVARGALGTAATLSVGAAIVAAPLALGYGFKKWQESDSGREADIRRWKLEAQQLDRRINTVKGLGDSDLLTKLQNQRSNLNKKLYGATSASASRWQQEIEQINQRIGTAKAANDSDMIARLERQRTEQQTQLNQVIAELKGLKNIEQALQQLNNRPIELHLDSSPIIDAVNTRNGRDARRQ
ncbi:phage tail tape measure protein [Herbaspirillum sp. HC18]|nr:phage tail tape measure protein [Herbaspirillum sp. HC18]